MHKHRSAERFAGFKKNIKARITYRHPVNIAANFHASEAGCGHDTPQFLQCQIHALQRHGSQANDAACGLGHHGGNLLVEEAYQLRAITGRHPVRQQFRHGRHSLQRQTHVVKVSKTLAHAPAFVRHGAVDLA